MPLPKIDVPTYTILLPISKIEVVYRPYLTKEEKLLLMALESKDAKTIISAITQVASNCVIVPEKFDIEKIPMIDIEYLFLNLRAKSKSEVLEAKFECKNVTEDAETSKKTCGNILTFSVRVDQLKVETPENFTNNISLTDKIGVIMSLPKYKDIIEATFSSLDENGDPKDEKEMVENSFKVLKKSINAIYDGDDLYDVLESSSAELDEFIDSLTSDQYMKIQNYFGNLPKINYKFDVKCPKCQFEHDVSFKDIASFF
jgi:hypothetical protein